MPNAAYEGLAAIQEYESASEYDDIDESQTFQSCQSRMAREEPEVASVANLPDVQTESQRAPGMVTGCRRPTEVKPPRFPKFN